MRKRVVYIMVCILMLAITPVYRANIISAAEEPSPRVFVDGIELVFDSQPVIEGGRTLVPMRAIFERLGATITWYGETSTVTASKGNTLITIQMGSECASIDGKQLVLDVAPKTINDRAMVPLRFISTALGCNVQWVEATNSIMITSTTVVAAPPTLGAGTSTSVPKNDGVAGVWMGTYLPFGSYTPQECYLIMYEDGTFYNDLPIIGLEGFNRSRSQQDEHQKDSWGTYTFANGAGTWKYNRSRVGETLTLTEEGNLKVGSTTYYRLASMDGLRLDGAWTTYADPKDPDLRAGGKQPIIHFTEDGRFSDEGVFERGFRSYLMDEDEQSRAPGVGSYEIKDFTLTLTYDDGRVRQTAFSLQFKAAQQSGPSYIMVYRTRLSRM